MRSRIPRNLLAFLSASSPSPNPETPGTVLVEWRHANGPPEWRPIHAVPQKNVNALVEAAARTYGGGQPILLRAGKDLWFAELSTPARLGNVRWNFDTASIAWSSKRSWPEAWDTCVDARWMLHVAARFVSAGELAAALSDLIAQAVNLAPSSEPIPASILVALRTWAWGTEPSNPAAFRALSAAATQAAERLRQRGDLVGAHAADAAASAAAIPIVVTDSQDRNAEVGAYAADAASHAADAAGATSMNSEGSARALAAMANRLRSLLPLGNVLHGLVS